MSIWQRDHTTGSITLTAGPAPWLGAFLLAALALYASLGTFAALAGGLLFAVVVPGTWLLRRRRRALAVRPGKGGEE